MEKRKLPHGSADERFSVLGLGLGGIQGSSEEEIESYRTQTELYSHLMRRQKSCHFPSNIRSYLNRNYNFFEKQIILFASENFIAI